MYINLREINNHQGSATTEAYNYDLNKSWMTENSSY